MRKSPAATLLRIFKLPCLCAGQLFYLRTGTERYKAFHSFDPSNTNEPSPFGIETEKAHLCCTTPVKRRRTLAAIEEKKSPHFVKFRNIFRTAAFVIAILPSALGIFFRGGTSFRYGSPIMLLCSLYLIDEVLAIILFYRLEMTDDIGDP